MDEHHIPELNQQQTLPKTVLKEQFTTVTPVSKFLAMVLFVALPFIGFWFGVQYQSANVSSKKIVPPSVQSMENTSISDEFLVTTATFSNEQYGFIFTHPNSWKQVNNDLSPRGIFNKDLVFHTSFKGWSEEGKGESNIFIRVYKTDMSLSEWLIDTYQVKNTELENYEIGKNIELSGINGFFSSTGCCGHIDDAYVVQRGEFIYEFGTNSNAPKYSDNPNVNIELIEKYKEGFRLSGSD